MLNDYCSIISLHVHVLSKNVKWRINSNPKPFVNFTNGLGLGLMYHFTNHTLHISSKKHAQISDATTLTTK